MASNFFTPDGAGFTSNSMEWRTPQELFERLDSEYHFNLDAAANEFNAKCEKYYTVHDNGLTKTWGGVQRLCKSTLWARHFEMGAQRIHRGNETGHCCGYANTCKDRHELLA